MRAGLIVALSVGLIGTASATRASQISHDWLGKYRSYSCAQLVNEAQSVSASAAALAGEKHIGKVHVASTEPTIVMPAILESTKQITGEIAIEREQLLAIEEAAIQSQCAIEFVSSN